MHAVKPDRPDRPWPKISAVGVQLFVGLALLMGSPGCGQPLVDGHYRGEPLETFSGAIILMGDFVWEGSVEDFTEKAKVTMTWAAPDGVDVFDSDLAVQMALRQEFPGNYEIEIYEPPPSTTFFDYADFGGDGSGKFAVADILVYDDGDDDGQWQPESEGILGRTMNGELILYTPAGLSDPSREVSLEPGFHIVRGLLGTCNSNLKPKEEIPPIELYDSSSSLPLSIADSFYFGADVDCDGIGDWHGCVGVILDYDLCIENAEQRGESAETACPEECFYTDFYECYNVPGEELRCHEEAAALGRDPDEYCPPYCFDYHCYEDEDERELEACIEEAYELEELPEEYCEGFCGSQFIFD